MTVGAGEHDVAGGGAHAAGDAASFTEDADEGCGSGKGVDVVLGDEVLEVALGGKAFILGFETDVGDFSAVEQKIVVDQSICISSSDSTTWRQRDAAS